VPEIRAVSGFLLKALRHAARSTSGSVVACVNFCARECGPLQPLLTAELISGFFAKVNALQKIIP